MHRGQLEVPDDAFRRLVETVEDYAIFLLDPHGYILTWNRGAEKMIGYARSEIIGQHFSRFYPPEDQQKPALELERAARDGRVEDEDWRVRKDGSRFWANVVITALFDDEGRLYGYAKVERDLTEQREVAAMAERAAAAEANTRVLTILAQAGAVLSSSLDVTETLRQLAQLVVPALGDWCIIDTLDDEGKIRSVVTHHSDPALLEWVRSLADRWPPDPNAPTGAPHVIRTGEPELYEEISDELLDRVVKDDEQRAVIRKLGLRSAVVVPMSSRGKVFGALTLISAESGRKYDRGDLALAQELAHRAAVAVENATLYRTVQEAVAARDEFISVASHELKTPLTALRVATESVQRQLHKAGVDDKIASRMATSVRQIDRLEGLVVSLLDVSRLAAGRFELSLESVDLAQLAREVAERFGEQAAAAGSPITVDAPDPVVGQWDKLRLEQVLTNLLANAIKYGRGAPIYVTVGAVDGRTRLQVIDRGIGIAPDDQHRIFERYERAVSSRNFGGLGLGLYITRRVVEAMGGEISVESETGKGAIFTVVL